MYVASSFLQSNLIHPIDQRVGFLREKARRDRWIEEVKLLEGEIKWTKRYFDFQVSQWEQRAAVANGPGYREYALRQASMWGQLADEAHKQIVGLF